MTSPSYVGYLVSFACLVSACALTPIASTIANNALRCTDICWFLHRAEDIETSVDMQRCLPLAVSRSHPNLVGRAGHPLRFTFYVLRSRTYSYLSASIGSRREAFQAG